MNANFELDPLFGKEARDKITGFKGIIVTKLTCLFGCAQYGIAQQRFDDKEQKRGSTEYFDEGRIEIIGEGINPDEVKVETPGADFNGDAPKS